MAKIGIDFGSYASRVSIIKNGVVKTLPCDCGLLYMPSYVAFTDTRRLIGVEAKNQAVANPSNTIFNFKRYLGRLANDEMVRNDLSLVPFQILKKVNNGITFKVKYLGKDRYFTPVEITAMLLRKLKEIAEKALKAEQLKVEDCVLSIPVYFTDAQIRALLDAAHIAGFNLTRLTLLNDPLAAGFSYAALHQQDLPEAETPPRNVVIIDCGLAALQISIFAFNKGSHKCLSPQPVVDLGGKAFDIYLSSHFFSKFDLNQSKDPQTCSRLLTEVEELKKLMTYWDDDEDQIKFKFLKNNKYLVDSMSRVEFEELLKEKNIFDTIRNSILMAFNNTTLSLSDIHSVELIGGSTRIPCLKNLIEKIFGKTPSTTMNKDLAISHGCAWAGTDFLPELSLSKFDTWNLFHYLIKVEWIMKGNRNRKTHVGPIMRSLPLPIQDRTIFFSGRTVVFRAIYMNKVAYATKVIGNYIVNLEGCDPTRQKLQFDVNINRHGVFCFIGATLVEEIRKENGAEVEEAEAEVEAKRQRIDNGEKGEGDNELMTISSSTSKTGSGEGATANGAVEVEYKKIKDLPIQRQVFETPASQVEKMRTHENSMNLEDKGEEERLLYRNRLDDYVQKGRTTVLDMVQNGRLKYKDVEEFLERLYTVGSRIYREDSNKTKEFYEKLLKELEDDRRRVAPSFFGNRIGIREFGNQTRRPVPKLKKRNSSPPPLIQL